MKKKISATGLSYVVNKGGLTCRIVGLGTYDQKELFIPDTIDGYKVKSIANEAFYDCTDLVSAEIAEGMTYIGAEAFCGCSALTCVKIPDSVTEIGWGAFLGCASLSDISIGQGVTEIAASAFCGCKGRVEIPAKTAFIGEQAFAGLREIVVSEENPFFMSADGNLYTKNGNTILQYATGKDELIFYLPEDVRSIGSFAFAGAKRLSAIHFEENLKTVGSNAFNGCALLWAAVLPEGLKNIGDSAFYGCSSLCAVSVGKNTDIGRGAFEECPKLRRIHRKGKLPLWKRIIFGKKYRADAPFREIKCKNWWVKFRF